MERRSALKNMGMVFGYAVATPTLLGLVQSCKEKLPYAEWVPSFFDKDKGYALAQMIDVILPKTDTPSGTEVNVHVFIDQFVKDVLPDEETAFMNMVMDKFMGKVMTDSGKETLADIEGEDFVPALTKYLKKMSDDEEKMQGKAIEDYMKAKMTGESPDLAEDAACFEFANNIRNMASWSYKTSEYIAEEVLAYLPLPGEYIPCADVDELTQGRAWSL